MLSFLVLGDGDTRNRWRYGQGTMAPWARQLGCVLACYAQIGRGRSRDFRDRPIRRNEGRVVNTPLVFKRVLFQEKRKRREREEEKRTERGDGKRKGRRLKRREREERRKEKDGMWRKGLSPGLEWKDDERRWR
ncbi:hypothetical protein TNCV_877781 [Trichonephila clavipes]|nr:hypothetical protein TNCV_877781 [Trichonephila clavipes]